MAGINGVSGFKRTFPIGNDVKYRGKEYDPHSPYIPKNQSPIATNIVAVDGSGDFEDIQSAIDALPSGGGSVFIKEGTYTITTKLSILKDNISLIGASLSSKIILGDNVNTSILDVGAGTTAVSGTIIKNLYFDGNKTNQSGFSACLYFHGAVGNVLEYGKIENCHLINSLSQCIYIGDARYFSINNNSITGSGGIALDFGYHTYNFVAALNQIRSNANGIRTCDYAAITGNFLRSNTGYGILGDNSSITGNSCVENGQGIICASGASIVSGNLLYGNSTGVQIDSNYNNVSGNKSYDGTGILVNGVDNNLISNNYVYATTGIQINANSDNIHLLGNYLKRCTTPIIDNGTNTIYGHNITT